MISDQLLSDTNLGVYQLYIFILFFIIFIIFGYDYLRKGSTNNNFKTIIGILVSLGFILFVIFDFKNVSQSFYMFYIGSFIYIDNPPLVCIKEDVLSELVCYIFAPQSPQLFITTRFVLFAFSLVPINYILSSNVTLILFLIRKKTLADLLYPPSWFWVIRPSDFVEENKTNRE